MEETSTEIAERLYDWEWGALTGDMHDYVIALRRERKALIFAVITAMEWAAKFPLGGVERPMDTEASLNVYEECKNALEICGCLTQAKQGEVNDMSEVQQAAPS